MTRSPLHIAAALAVAGLCLFWVTIAAAIQNKVSSSGTSSYLPKVFSNLQHNSTESSELPPYPVDVELTLTCLVTGRKTYWLEGREDLPCIRSEPFQGLGVCKYSVGRLRLEDDGRLLSCMMDSSTAREDVTLRVVGPPILKVAFSDGNFEQQDPKAGIRGEIDLSKEREATFKCESAEMSPNLKLCWFRDDKLVTCEGNASEASVSMSVNLADTPGNLHLACKPQFGDKMFAALKLKVQKQFEEMFDRVQLKYEVNITDVTMTHQVGITVPEDGSGGPHQEPMSKETKRWITVSISTLGKTNGMPLYEPKTISAIAETSPSLPPRPNPDTTTDPSTAITHRPQWNPGHTVAIVLSIFVLMLIAAFTGLRLRNNRFQKHLDAWCCKRANDGKRETGDNNTEE